ncbi:alpha/beta hydrolase [Massilia oculi]|uniref:Alpha/beta hydrolase n=1 Tax=Massilia hydrophila TaxID=3044279 RepID=A0ABS7YF76_9BURK|nr:alpha/beta fold hydrolase [Massilia oculi]MCA1858362.1 alpha/beta hydrolase [Massilia oculi]
MRRLSALLPLLFTLPAALAAIPADTHLPADIGACTAAAPCPVAVLSPGYGLAGTDYGFLTRQLNGMGYLVLALRDSAGGATIDRGAPITPQVQAIARATARGIAALLDEGAARDRRFDWRRVLLVGHSLGGDSSAQFAADHPQRVSALVSLDSRRVALPRTDGIRVLSIRASDTAADPGVLPDEGEQRRHGSCIVRIEGARHNDMQDEGSARLKEAILAILETFLAPARQPAYACSPAPAS